ncbi:MULTISPECIES: UDP-2,4-diacetamido-2,4,6-trideoxy-beta-L-altropyranose hydrolase [unclassified Clostridium]|nr:MULTISPECIES: UDP-2,4-diacetamido-2,4,6-trideoxy-beta-L-altropyranose hydrolase [unclassified Clostridium]
MMNIDKSKIIFIRADGGKDIGLGHIMRMLVLAKALNKEHNVIFICKKSRNDIRMFQDGIKKIKANDFNVLLINEEHVAAEIIKLQRTYNADMLITDSYDVDKKYFEKLKPYFKLTGYMDDINKCKMNVDFIINQNFNAEYMDYSKNVNKETKLFLGSKYCLLRDEFKNIKSKTIKSKVFDIIITLGGSDPNGIMNILYDYIKKLDFIFHIVIGPSFNMKNIKAIKKLNETQGNINLYFNANMSELMKKCDIAISSCGSTLYELSACGVPTIGVIIADNQRDVAINLDNKGIIKNLGWYSSINEKDLRKSILELDNAIYKRIEMSKKATNFIDGMGAERILKEITNLY